MQVPCRLRLSVTDKRLPLRLMYHNLHLLNYQVNRLQQVQNGLWLLLLRYYTMRMILIKRAIKFLLQSLFLILQIIGTKKSNNINTHISWVGVRDSTLQTYMGHNEGARADGHQLSKQIKSVSLIFHPCSFCPSISSPTFFCPAFLVAPK